MNPAAGVQLDHSGFIARFGPRSHDWLTLGGALGIALLFTSAVATLGLGPSLCLGPVVWFAVAVSVLPVVTRRELRLSADGLRLVIIRPWSATHRRYPLRALSVQPYAVDEARYLELKDERTGAVEHLPFGAAHEEWKWWASTLRQLCEAARASPEVALTDSEAAARHRVMSLLAELGPGRERAIRG